MSKNLVYLFSVSKSSNPNLAVVPQLYEAIVNVQPVVLCAYGLVEPWHKGFMQYRASGILRPVSANKVTRTAVSDRSVNHGHDNDRSLSASASAKEKDMLGIGT